MKDISPEQALGQILGAMLPAVLGKPDWVFREFPMVRPEAFERITARIGAENLLWIYEDEGHTAPEGGEVVLKGGAALISPAGMAIVHEEAERLRKRLLGAMGFTGDGEGT